MDDGTKQVMVCDSVVGGEPQGGHTRALQRGGNPVQEAEARRR